LYTPDALLEAHQENMEKGLTPEILKEEIKKNPYPITNKLKKQVKPSSAENKNNTDDHEPN
jgi:hypothetical protein